MPPNHPYIHLAWPCRYTCVGVGQVQSSSIRDDGQVGSFSVEQQDGPMAICMIAFYHKNLAVQVVDITNDKMVC